MSPSGQFKARPGGVWRRGYQGGESAYKTEGTKCPPQETPGKTKKNKNDREEFINAGVGKRGGA